MGKRISVGVIFGGRSVEHEVSVVTGIQVLENLDLTKYKPVPIYIDKDGKWWTGDALFDIMNFKNETLKGLIECLPVARSNDFTLYRDPMTRKMFESKEVVRVDVFFPVVHGTNGEDGSLQGLFETMNIPYTGCGVVAAAVGMDKILMKSVFKAEGLPIVPHLWFYRGQWAAEKEMLIQQAEAIGYPLVVKPANLGSSIGISKAEDQAGLNHAVEVAMSYDRKVIIEKAILPLREINCAVMGRDADLMASVCEEPATWEDFLSYEDKYINGGKGGKGGKGMESAKRRIPADLPDEQTVKIQQLAKDAFRAIDARGDARIDFLLSATGEIYVNEINTLPGSMAFYLWEAGGISFKALCTKQIELALAAHQEKQKNVTSYDVKLYQRMGGGVKK